MSDEGASPRELLLEACRRNNTELLHDVFNDIANALSEKGSPSERTADLINNARDGIGNNCLHIAATYGSYDALDLILDQEGVEVDPVDRLEKDTPLHKSVRFVNGLSKDEWDEGKSIVEILVDAGADPRIRNKANLKAMDLVDPRNTELRSMLQRAEFAMTAGGDVVQEDDEEDGAGSASDSE
ncbi:hypothetical protein L228DRAFT_247810 [Xylona heveae TC161]|uniref:Uncharacterized protein n=1 Tax=Xylona heveae (strain CBS 132557 / TC161) TaxID=1328760 RepID=A0A165GHD0_XYLHT|nr:hypothetical protein L228DRAFT_247810 [Xylona heveae TC161]KZF22184.1 hypothetical protein L228DRAFT_247810 [Xylona heveae TC161]